eukprot:1159447-Pelagomonas_calceolata.AAC.8
MRACSVHKWIHSPANNAAQVTVPAFPLSFTIGHLPFHPHSQVDARTTLFSLAHILLHLILEALTGKLHHAWLPLLLLLLPMFSEEGTGAATATAAAASDGCAGCAG